MEVSGAAARCKALENEVRLGEDRIRKVQETRANDANALSQTILKMKEEVRKSAQELVEARVQHAALSKVMAELQGAGAQAAEELEEHKIAAACNAAAQDHKMRTREAELEKALLDVRVELQALESHTAAAMKDKAQETTVLEAKNAELETQLLKKAKLVELQEKHLERIRMLVGHAREEAHNKVEEMEQEVTKMEERVKALKRELTEAKDERAAALSALTLEFMLEKAETEKAQNLMFETKLQKMEQRLLLLKEAETERDWLAQSYKAAMAERLAAHKEEKDEWKAARESYQSRYDKQQELIDKYNTQLEEKQTRYFAEVATTSMHKSELADVKEKYAEAKEKLEAADAVQKGLTEELNETRALLGVVTNRNTELTSVAHGMEGKINTLHTLKAEPTRPGDESQRGQCPAGWLAGWLADREVARMAPIQDGLKIELQEAMRTLATLQSQEMALRAELIKAKAILSASDTEIYQQERSKLVKQKQQVEAELEQATKQLKHKDDEIPTRQLKNEELEAEMASLEALKCASMQSLQECNEHMQADEAKIENLQTQMAHAKQTSMQLAVEKPPCPTSR
jgi:chromosome segregation ATPase